MEQRILYMTPVIVMGEETSKDYDTAETSGSLKAARFATNSKLARRLDFSEPLVERALRNSNDAPLRPE